jgi:hypothetical protein
VAQTEIGWPVSLSLSTENWAESKEQSGVRSAQSSASCRRSEPAQSVAKDRSPALPYPPHECRESTFPAYPPFAKGTSLLCRTGDISTLH